MDEGMRAASQRYSLFYPQHSAQIPPKTTGMNIKEQFNLNSLITLIIAFMNMLMFIIGTFLWSTVTKTQEEVRKMGESVATAVANQNHLQRTIEQIIPKGELELRFKSIEIDILSLKTRVQQTDAALLKIQQSKP